MTPHSRGNRVWLFLVGCGLGAIAVMTAMQLEIMWNSSEPRNPGDSWGRGVLWILIGVPVVIFPSGLYWATRPKPSPLDGWLIVSCLLMLFGCYFQLMFWILLLMIIAAGLSCGFGLPSSTPDRGNVQTARAFPTDSPLHRNLKETDTMLIEQGFAA
jgi:hypothetical protein